MNLFAFGALANVVAVARREFVTRVTTRTYLVATLCLILAAALVGLAPVAIGYVNRESSHVAVYVGAADLRGDPVATLDSLLNPSIGGDEPGATAYTIRRSTDLEADRRRVRDGTLTALLDIERDASGETTFTVYTGERPTSSTVVVSRQAASAIAIADRLGRAGVAPTDQARLFAVPQVIVRPADPSAPVASSQEMAQQEADVAVMFGLELFLLLAIILYGTWIAQSVAEEKSSRMMEIVLSAASPFELLAGKVLGVSAAALLQFVAVIATSVAAVLAESQVAARVLGDSTGVALPSGLTAPVVAAFCVLFVLGFVLYAALFAAAGSLVSRQEDVNQIVQPVTLAACGGYLVAMYGSIGLLDSGAPWITALSWIPFLSPYTMLARVGAGDAGVVEVGAVVLLMALSVVLAAWFASRIYAAGVLMYGQKPSFRGMWRAVREGR